MEERETTASRRSGSETRQRTKVQLTRYTPAELTEIEGAAIKLGLTLSSFTRTAALSAARGSPLVGLPVRSVRRPPVEKELLSRILGQLGKIGSNVNQAARATNINNADRAEIMEAAQMAREAAALVIQALGRKP